MNRERQQGEVVPSRYEFRGIRRDGTLDRRGGFRSQDSLSGRTGHRGHLSTSPSCQLVQEQLRQSQKMQAIGTLAGGVAHDFNNVLAISCGNAELALDDLKGSKRGPGKPQTNIVGVEAGSRSVKQILTFSRKTMEDRQPLKITPLIRETFKMLRAPAEHGEHGA